MSELTLRKRIALEAAALMSRNILKEHPLRQLFWECTLRCNVSCRHCGSDCRKLSEVKDMPREDFFHVLDSIAGRTDPHRVFVTITGGEPLLRDDLEVCGKEIFERGFPWGMVTNGLILTPERFESLRKAGMHSVTVSMDGLEENHNWMRRHPQSFQMVDQVLDLFVQHPQIASDVVTCVNQRNYEQLPAIRDYLISKGIGYWRIYSIFPVGRAANDPVMQISNEQYRGMLDFIRKTRQEGRIHVSYGCEGFLGRYEGEVRELFFNCQAGVTVGSVMADGSIAACASIRADYHQGNIYEDDFMEVWENRYMPYRNREWMRKGECKDCRYWRYCQGNGMHLRDGNGNLILCHLKRIQEPGLTVK
jgi:radical SAM enzyme (rSAM/lipoprotein system)